MTNPLIVSSSPHVHTPDTTRGVMLDVLIALAPAALFSIVLFSWRAAVMIAVCIATCVLAEVVSCKILGHDVTIGDLSAVVTGLLLAMNLPANPSMWWMAMIGCLVAIVVVKQMFGGLGHNFVNPAIAARIVLFISFPVAMTSYIEPLTPWGVTPVTSPTPLAGEKVYELKTLVFGLHGGSLGETSVLLLGIGALYLILRRVINPVIPVSFIGTVALLTWATGGQPLVAICSGGLMLGACFMATDYVTSPTTHLGKLIFGLGCGVLTFLIRNGSAAEGVSFSILFMNLLVPHIDNLTKHKPFGWEATKS